jgi:hypothetical protein
MLAFGEFGLTPAFIDSSHFQVHEPTFVFDFGFASHSRAFVRFLPPLAFHALSILDLEKRSLDESTGIENQPQTTGINGNR